MEEILTLKTGGERVAATFDEAAEADSGRGMYSTGGPAVMASIVAAPAEWTPKYNGGRALKGAVLRLEEPLRITRDGGFVELPVGTEWKCESRLIDHEWDFREGSEDEARREEREQRYREQDAIREAFGRLGMPEAKRGGFAAGFSLEGDRVVIGRELLTKWLERVDPVRIVEEAFAEVERGGPYKGEDEWADGVQRVVSEVRDGLAVSDAELVPSTTEPF